MDKVKNNKKDELSSSNLKSKLFIIIVFLIAVTLAVMAGIMSIQNKKLESKLIDVPWKIEYQSKSIVEDKAIKVPKNSAEFIGVSKQLKDIVRDYHLLRMKNELKDDRQDRREMIKNIQFALNDLGVTTGYDPSPVSAKTYKKKSKKNPKNIYYEGVRVKFNTPISRSKIIQFIMNIEDKYPFLTAQYLKLYRDKNNDKEDMDDWKGEVDFIWFFTDSSSV